MTRVRRDPWRGTRLRHATAATISTCTRLRLAGDWRGACAEAGFHVDIDLDEAAASYGAAAARQLESDLRSLAPDLLRQYLPAEYHELTGWHGAVALSRLAEPSRDALARTASSPPVLAIALAREPDTVRRPRLAIAGPAGISTSATSRTDRYRWRPDGLPPFSTVVLPVWCWRADAVAERRDAHTPVRTDPPTHAHPTGVAAVPDDVVALREGRMSPDDLHPLVHDVLYPGRVRVPTATGWEWPAIGVRCGGVWHEVRIAGGRLDTPAHTDDEIGRELAAGGPAGVPGCVNVLRAWRTGRGHLPKRLHWQRADFFRHAYYGHTDDVLAMLDAGFDIAARDGVGATLMHYLGRVDHRRLWPRLREAGLPPDSRDHEGHTPLANAVALQAEEVVAGLLAAGADPHAADTSGRSLVDWQEWHMERYRRQAGYLARQAPPSSILARLREHPVGAGARTARLGRRGWRR